MLAKWKTDHEAIEAELAKRQAGVDATKEVLRRIFASDPQHSTTFAPGTVDNSDIPGILSTIEVSLDCNVYAFGCAYACMEAGACECARTSGGGRRAAGRADEWADGHAHGSAGVRSNGRTLSLVSFRVRC